MESTKKNAPELYQKLQYSQGIILVNPDKSVTVSKIERRDDGGLNQRISTYSDMRTMSIARSQTPQDEKPPWKPCPGQTVFPKNPYDPNLGRPRPCPSLSSCGSYKSGVQYSSTTSPSSREILRCKNPIPKDYQGYMTSILRDAASGRDMSSPTTRHWKFDSTSGTLVEYKKQRNQRTSNNKRYKTKNQKNVRNTRKQYKVSNFEKMSGLYLDEDMKTKEVSLKRKQRNNRGMKKYSTKKFRDLVF